MFQHTAQTPRAKMVSPFDATLNIDIIYNSEGIMTHIPYMTLANGLKMPQFGLGVYQVKDGIEVEQAVTTAIEDGYRLIDTAALYGNEVGVGQAIMKSSVPREELFITTKLWNTDQGYDATLNAFETSLEKLGLDYIDLYLIHWPSPQRGLYLESWKAFEELYKKGRVKAIGVSNFHPEHLDMLLKEATVVPMVNQIELHPYLQQHEIVDYNQAHGIVTESWSPIGGGGGSLLSDPAFKTIGDVYGKSPAQVVIRWHIQHGYIVIPKSSHPIRIAENADVFDFELSDKEMAKIDGLNTDERIGPDPRTADF
jgi:2,5-diketo-D-gluconate reductase A